MRLKLLSNTVRLLSLSRRMTEFDNNNNPLLLDWYQSSKHGLAPFELIKSSHFEPAFEYAMNAHLNEIENIVSLNETPTFENVILPYDKAGSLMKQIDGVYSNLCSSLLTPDLQIVQTQLSPVLTNHYSRVYSYKGLFEKIETIYEKRKGLDDGIQVRFVEQLYNEFKRNGAKFSSEQQNIYGKIKEELSSLYTTFSQNVMKDEESIYLELTVDDLDGLPDFLIAAAKNAASERNKDGYVITISRSLVVPFLTFSTRKDLRKIAYEKWVTRGERNNLPVIKRILQLRKSQAKMHGFDNFSQYALDDTMAKTTANVSDLLNQVWEKAKVSFERERKCLEEFIHEESNGKADVTIDNEDWRYYAEKVRQSKYQLEEVEIKKYFKLDNVVAAAFDCSNKLFGLKFVLTDIKAYHEDAKVYEVYQEGQGSDELIAIFIHDNFSRMYKSSGAWMSELRRQSFSNGSRVVPIVINNNNFARGVTTLLSFDDCRTLFHELGHGHHGMLSQSPYEYLASTSVLRDFVELPSQLYEHWFNTPAVLKKFARHYETNAEIPDDLLNKLFAAKSFNQGFDTIEYTACALIDQSFHQADADDIDIEKIELSELKRLQMPKGISLRHRPSHFLHLFSGESYASAYYVYLWAEILDADAFEAFQETGNVFDKETANRVRKYIYESGNTIDPREAFKAFRGRDAIIEPMLKKKGLVME